MRLRHITAAFAAITLLAATPAAAGASISQELAAANKVERTAARYYPRYHVVASCDQETRTYFWCDFIGQSGDCWIEGNASVRLSRSWWTTKLRSIQRDCY